MQSSKLTCGSQTEDEFLRHELQTVPSPIWEWTSKDRIIVNIRLQIQKGIRWVGKANDSVVAENRIASGAC